MPSTKVQVVAVGGTEVASVLAVVGELSQRSGLAIIASCAALDAGALRGACALPVTEVEGPVPIAPDRVYLAAAGRHVAIVGEQLVAGGADRAPFDALLRSIASEHGREGVGVVLAGHGTDGSIGIKLLKEAGGLTVAQQIEGAAGELPTAAIETGLVDLVLPLEQIAARVGELAVQVAPSDVETAQATLDDLLTLVRARTGHDFSSYKRATLLRRIARRAQVRECASLAAYERYARDHHPEVALLLRDFLISVTNFFRDPEVFAALAATVVPKLFAHKGPSDQVRVWVAGCATGEEAYSIGMLLLEHAGTLPSPPAIQIFATDIDEHALVEARLGCYSEAITADVSPERLRRFFVRDNEQYRVTKELRDMVLFSPHSVLRDPPFSRLDLLSCRNLLIYLEREAQLRVLAMFHFGLRLDGVLMLGSSESAEGTPMFGAIDGKNRLYTRRIAPVATFGNSVSAPPRWQGPVVPSLLPRERTASLGALHYRLIEHYAPPSALIDAELDIIHLSENAGSFFQLAGGEPTRQVLRLVIEPLRLELRTAIYAARQRGAETRVVRYDEDGETRTVEIRVRTVDLPELAQGAMLVMLARGESTEAVAPSPAIGEAIEPVVREIEDELNRTRVQLRSTIEQYEISLEELKASNEELQAINEELRSATEELETSKEEMQSVNEELTTLNHELKIKVDEVSHANSDLQNLMSSTEIGVVFLDRKLCIKRFTPRVEELFNIIPSDLGRPLAHLTHRLDCDDLVETAAEVLATLHAVERRIASLAGRTYLVRWLPYRSLDERVEGVVVTFIDVSDLRDAVAARQRSETALEVVEARLRMALRDAPVTVLSFDTAQRLTWAYAMGREVPPDQLEPLAILSPEHDQLLREIVRDVSERRRGRRAEIEVRAGAQARTFDFRIEPIANGATAVGFDITPSKVAEVTLREADRRKDEFLATLSHELRNPLTPLKVALDLARLVDHDPARRAKSFSVMERQVKMLSELVDELLDLSRITQGKVALDSQVLELQPLIERAVEATAAAVSGNHHELAVALPREPIHVIGDLHRLVQIFTNLLVNAAKYTPANGRIEIGATVDRARGRVAITVGDNGVGMAQETLDHIFEIFVQSRDEAGRSQGGLGIGLNVVHRLVELHGGKVSATSDGAGRGSVFTVELPMGRPV